MSEKSMEERMATVEAEVSATKALAEKIDGKLDRWRDEHFTKEEVREMLRSRDEKVDTLQSAFDKHLEQEQTQKQTNKMNGFQWALVAFSGLSGIAALIMAVVQVAHV